MSACSSQLFVTLLASSALSVPLANCQQRSQRDSVFISADSTFQFSYPSNFQICKAGNMGPCEKSFIPACDSDALICVVYPTEAFAGNGLEAAAFQISEIHDNRQEMTADVCATPYPPKTEAGVSEWPEFMISAKHPTEMIDGVLFVHGTIGDGATSHWHSVDLYRTFHRGRCFELALSEAGTDPGVSDPPEKPLSLQQQKSLDAGLSRILHSFRFRQ